MLDFKVRIKTLLDYWSATFDPETKSVDFIFRDFNQGVLRQENKALLIHTRQLYNFSYGFDSFKDDKYKHIAQNLAESYEGIFSVGENFYSSFSIKDETISCYDQIYLSLSLCKYSEVFKNREVYNKALDLAKNIKGIFQENNSKLFYNKYYLRSKNRSDIYGNTLLHYFELLINLYKTHEYSEPNEFDLDCEINEIIVTFEKFILDKKSAIVYENLDDNFNWKLEEKYAWVTNAHVLEWLGFIFEYSLLSNKKIDILDNFEVLTKKLIKRGFQNNGCFWNIYYPYADKSLDIADFWATPEIILGLLYCSKYSGNPYYATVATEVYNFHESYFCDNTYGGIYSAVRSDGLIIDRTKGFERKCDHHFFRMCEKIQEYNLDFPYHIS